MWRHWLGRAGGRPHARPLRRARVRALRPRARRALARHLGRRPRDRRRRRGPRSLRAARRLAGSRDRARLRGAASRAAHASSSSTAATRAAGRGAAPEERRHAEAMISAIRAGWTEAEPRVPPPVQHAVPPARDRRSRWRGTTSCSGARRRPRPRCASTRRATASTCVDARAAGDDADAGACTRAGTGSCRSRRDGCSPPASRAPGSSCWSRRTTSCCRTSRRGERSCPSSSLPRHASRHPPATAVTTLSPRELDVLELVAAGLTNEAIAERLCLSVRTVERHLSNVYAKLRVSGKAGRAAAAARFSETLRAGRQRDPPEVAWWHRCRAPGERP